jgi:multicomponent Na+:H+ antiporter subunit F
MTVPVSEVLLGLLGLPLLLGFMRLVRGPSLPDRVVALDFMAAVAVAVSGIWAIATGNPVFLDVAMVLALISFVGTVAFSRYLERRGPR